MVPLSLGFARAATSEDRGGVERSKNRINLHIYEVKGCIRVILSPLSSIRPVCVACSVLADMCKRGSLTERCRWLVSLDVYFRRIVHDYVHVLVKALHML